MLGISFIHSSHDLHALKATSLQLIMRKKETRHCNLFCERLFEEIFYFMHLFIVFLYLLWFNFSLELKYHLNSKYI